jgi:pyridoxal phosphate enzyme (YggS family)
MPARVNAGPEPGEIVMTPSPCADSVRRLAGVADAVRRATVEAGREPGAVTLVAVSKTFDAAQIVPVLEAGQRVFGENRVQEAKAKWPALRECFPGVALHLIGPLQSNKAKEAVALFDVIETVDRESIAVALAAEIRKAGRGPKLHVQVNTGVEPQKAGVPPREADAFLARCREEWGLTIEGLMCIPPADEPPSPHFALLRVIAERNGLKLLSMGMSSDFEEAIQLGATHVRVGSAIFGSRG